MKIHLNRPDVEHPLFDALLNRWKSVLRPEDELVLYRAFPGEAHEDLLVRIWRSMEAKSGTHIITEYDFIPFKTMPDLVDRLMEDKKAVFSSHIRWVNDGFGVHERWPMIAMWFTALDPARIDGTSESWFRSTDPPRSDPGELFYCQALMANVMNPEDVVRLDPVSSWPTVRGALYTGIGVHPFCSHHYADNPGTIVWPTKEYTIGEHIDAIWKVLEDPDTLNT